MLKFTFVIISLLQFFTIVNGRSGVDLSVATAQEDWDCLVKQYNINYSFIRLYRSKGEIDVNGPQSIKLAIDSGINDVGGYIFPCISSSPYALSNNITCFSASDQVLQTVKLLESNEITIERSINIKSKYTINRIWLDIEDEQPSKYFDPDYKVNQQFIADMVATMTKLHIPIGIYTTKTYWQNIMGNIEGYSQYPLWYPRYDGINSFDFFAPFAGWNNALIKQTAGDAPLCGISQVDTDYMLDA